MATARRYGAPVTETDAPAPDPDADDAEDLDALEVPVVPEVYDAGEVPEDQARVVGDRRPSELDVADDDA